MYLFEEIHAMDDCAYLFCHFTEFYNFLQNLPFVFIVVLSSHPDLGLLKDNVEIFPDESVA
jgi:hypothetical protein